jgi:hypothetical protein
MTDHCTSEACTQPAIASLEDRALCRTHFLAFSYRRLDNISAQIREAEFHSSHAERASRFLEDCMRYAADVACSPDLPSNLEKAQVLDVLLWASELHGYLRRGPRVPAQIPIHLRYDAPGKSWEESTETRTISRHGLLVILRRELQINDVLLCTRIDNGWHAETRVVWTRGKASGENEIGLEFLGDENFWGLGSSGVARSRAS